MLNRHFFARLRSDVNDENTTKYPAAKGFRRARQISPPPSSTSKQRTAIECLEIQDESYTEGATAIKPTTACRPAHPGAAHTSCHLGSTQMEGESARAGEGARTKTVTTAVCAGASERQVGLDMHFPRCLQILTIAERCTYDR